jgi:hypothetical protein
MDKIPAALQCQIDMVNALDRTDDFKSKCIVTLIKDYLLECQLKAHGRPQSIAKLWDIINTKSNVELLKEINSFGVQPSTPWPQIQTPSDTLKYVPYESPNDKPIGPGNTKIKRDGSDWKPFYVTFCFCAAFVLCGAVGLTLGAIFGSSL